MVSKTLCQLIWIAILVHGISAVCNDPWRHRKAWHSKDAEEDRRLYINGFIELSKQGKLQQFTMQHANDAARFQAHRGSGFLPWHRYFIWELESQIRFLGGEYECFNLPYWDWAYDANRVNQNAGDNLDGPSDFYILNSGLGGNGDPSDDWCITDGSAFSKGNYEPYRDCVITVDNNGNCCLKRQAAPDATGYTDATDVAELITDNPSYIDFVQKLEYNYHDGAHVGIGGDVGNDMNAHLGDPRHSPDDPIFFLLHAFVDYIWALWQDCHDYDRLTRAQAANTPDAYQGDKPNTSPSDPLNFDILASNGWAKIRPHGVVLNNEGNRPLSILTPDHPAWLTIMNTHLISDWYYEYEHDYLYDTMKPWFDETDILSCSNSGFINRGSRNITSFADQVWDQLTDGLNLGRISRATGQSLFSSLARINCEMKQSQGGREPCKRPKCFDDCSDLIPCDDHSGKDINVTLDELIEKVQGYPCMIETRRRYYQWAKESGSLLELCRGDYDNFCDGGVIEGETSLDSCPISESYAKAVIEEGNGEGIYGSEGGVGRRGGKRSDYGMKGYSAQNEQISVISEPNHGDQWGSIDYGVYVLIAVITVIFNLIAYSATYMYYINKKKKEKIVTKY